MRKVIVADYSRPQPIGGRYCMENDFLISLTVREREKYRIYISGILQANRIWKYGRCYRRLLTLDRYEKLNDIFPCDQETAGPMTMTNLCINFN